MDGSKAVGQATEVSPRAMARLAGLFYLLTILAGVFAQRSSDELVVFGDAAATAANILAQEGRYRLGFTLYLVEMTCQLASTALFYLLLRPVSRSVSLVAAFIGLAGCTIKTVSRLFYLAPLLVLEGQHTPGAFDTAQLQALALLFLEVNDRGAGIALAFFGFFALLKGYLIVRSTFLPRFLGVLSMLAGLMLATFLSPVLGHELFARLAPFVLLAAVAQILWLLTIGVNEVRWRAQAAAAIWI